MDRLDMGVIIVIGIILFMITLYSAIIITEISNDIKEFESMFNLIDRVNN
jgi:hypothetical protein